MYVPKHLPPPPLPAADESWAMFLDVDGSLLDFADQPEQVFVPDSLKQLLHHLHHALDGALALVSGRNISDLDSLFGIPGWAKAGLHGLELQRPDGHRRDIEIDPRQQAKLRREAAALADCLPGVRLEDKGLAVALHTRRAPQQWEALREGTEALIGSLPGFELQPGNQVIEIKPSGMNKGVAVSELLSLPPFTGRTPVYVGDDLTDEHAFATVNLENGISVRVGEREPSLAQFTLSTPTQLHAWLNRVRVIFDEGATSHANRPGGLRTTRES
ncbi:MAG: trehalose-phosphatase [Dyella sp.]